MAMLGIRTVSYFFISYAFYGYWLKYGVLIDVQPFAIEDACSLVGSDFTYVGTLDEYFPIDATACGALQGQELLQVSGTQIISTAAGLDGAIKLALTDIINAGDWLIIVVLLEVEVFLQLKGQLGDRLIFMGKYLKGFFYLVLFACAAYWGMEGDFLDFWDAFLWLVAFILIELNIFQWHEEIEGTVNSKAND